LRERRAIQQLANFTPDPDMLMAERESLARAYIQELNSVTGVLDNIAIGLSGAGLTAGQSIQRESRNIFAGNYRSQSRILKSQAREAGIRARWFSPTQVTIDTAFRGSLSPRFISTALNQMALDRARSEFYFNQAVSRLSDSTSIAQRLLNEISRSIARGEGVEQITRRIQSIAQSCHYRAIRIAQTQSLRCANQGRYAAALQYAEEYGLDLEKTWHHAPVANVPRENHAEINGETVDLTEAFSIGLMYPLDPKAPPEETIFCSCGVSFRIKKRGGSNIG